MSPQKLSLALGTSALLNAFLIGYMVSHSLMPRPVPPPMEHSMHGPHDHLERAAAVLPPPYQDKVDTILKVKNEKLKNEFETIHKLFDQLHPLMTAPHYDEKKVEALEKDIDTHDRLIKDTMAATMKDIAHTLPDEQRILFFNTMLSHDKGHDPKPMPDDMPPPPDGAPHSESHDAPHDEKAPDSGKATN